MSTPPTTAPATSVTPDAHTNGKFHIFIQVAMLLAAITGIEMILIFIPFPRWIVVGSLIALSAVKFGYVIFAFMHLRWDRLFCTLLFMIGLTLAGGILWALLQLFASEASRPVETSQNTHLHAHATITTQQA